MVVGGSVVLLLLTLVGLPVTQSVGPVVDTTYGQVEGVYSNISRNFYGLPFAAPPVGPLRWQTPVVPKSWNSTVYDATKAKSGCMQVKCESMNPSLVCPNVTSEDCLYLNVYTPLWAEATANLPVMLFIHGGNFVHMTASCLMYQGDVFVNKSEVILVTTNYRLGALGFLVTGSAEQDAHGNYGIMDQRFALKWVQENIKGFGGNPTQVTLFGQSAGAQSTIVHLMSEKSDPYFQKAIIESAPFTIPFKTHAEVLLLGDYLAGFLNCPPGNMDCLRSKSALDIATAQFQSRSKIASLKFLEEFEPWGPWVDGAEIKMEPVAAYDKGLFSNKPMLIGTTSEEARIHIYDAWKTPVKTPEYALVIVVISPLNVLKILEEYPPSNPTDERDNLAIFGTDFIFICSTRHVARASLQKNQTDTWLYLYDHAFSFPGWEPNFNFCQGHVCHGSELPILFHTATLAGFHYTKDELILANNMLAYFTNFAKTGDPNSSKVKGLRDRDLLSWPRYSDTANWPVMRFMTPNSKLDPNFNAPHCDFWDKIGYKA